MATAAECRLPADERSRPGLIVGCTKDPGFEQMRSRAPGGSRDRSA